MPQNILHLNASVLSAATVVGSKERGGPLGQHFDFYGENDRFGQDTWVLIARDCCPVLCASLPPMC